MSGSRLAVTWRMMALAFVLPLLLILAIDITLASGIEGFDGDEAFTRFANATLTSYTLLSLLLLGNLFFYTPVPSKASNGMEQTLLKPQFRITYGNIT